MNISFDLDDLLINGVKRFEVEKTGLLKRMLTPEQLHLGTVGLFKTLHDQTMKNLSIPCSKYPPVFGIDLHIDDSEGVRLEAEKYGFRALIIGENDPQWAETVLRAIDGTASVRRQ